MKALFATTALAAGLALGSAASAQAAEPSSVFQLGELQVTAQDSQGQAIGGATVPGAELQKFQKETVDRALDLIPGTAASNSGGSRNEQLVYIRGFDRFQTTLSIDGVRVYLPADNRLDFGRFLTADLSEIQVSKGYVPVIDGPGGIGGAINLVTRKPSKPLEAEVRGGLSFDRDGSTNGYTASALIGVRRDIGYLQVSAARADRDHFALSDRFRPTPNENGGFRDNSDSEDWRVNVKAGLTPNATDEYSLNFTRQKGSKGAPYHTGDPIASQRYWDWPYWDIDSLYFLSSTRLAEAATLKLKAYYNTFDNGLYAYDDPAQTLQTKPKAFRSYYADEAYGGSAELNLATGAANSLKAALHWRRDDHVEWQDSYSPSFFREPKQKTVEDTWSAAVEDTLKLGPDVDLTGAVSYDWRDLKKAQDFASGALIDYRLADSDGWNGQAAAVWRAADGVRLHASVSSRQRFPTIFERFSSRFGGAVSNPDLKPERALNLEVGGAFELAGGWHVEGAVFHSDIDDAIVSVPFVFQGQNVSQSRNVGKGEYYGFEAAFSGDLGPTLRLGWNYTYLHRHLDDPNAAGLEPTGTPEHKLFVYADWKATPRLTVTPSLEAASSRWTVTSNGALYYRTGGYVTPALGAAWSVTPQIVLEAGVRNLFDANYQLVDGFPEQGRNYYLTARARL